MDLTLITIKESHNLSDLLVPKSMLEAEGITCYLKNENITQIMSHMTNFMVELQVYSSDLESAKEILKSFDNQSSK